jgi:DNA-binding GntR family transcriptional regulator
MTEKTKELNYLLLSCLIDSEAPVGAGSLLDFVRQYGISVSEATIGRALRDLRIDGFLTRVGNQGHQITDSGRKSFMEMKNERAISAIAKTFAKEFGEISPDNLIGLLTARKALEREAVIQATLNGTCEELDEIADIVALQYEKMKAGDDLAEMSGNFHRAIFRISHVPFLEQIYSFLGMSISRQRFFVDTFTVYDVPINLDHEKILEAMKARDPEKAAVLMTSHIEDVIKNVKRTNTEIQYRNITWAWNREKAKKSQKHSENN